jgi:hypothetical protein
MKALDLAEDRILDDVYDKREHGSDEVGKQFIR